jgi:hypothetical protein
MTRILTGRSPALTLVEPFQGKRDKSAKLSKASPTKQRRTSSKNPRKPRAAARRGLGARKESALVTTTAKEEKRRRRRRSSSVLEQLIAGCDADRVAVHFLDGTVREGALLFNAIKRSGKLINVEEEFSLDFDTRQVKTIKILKQRDASELPLEDVSEND